MQGKGRRMNKYASSITNVQLMTGFKQLNIYMCMWLDKKWRHLVEQMQQRLITSLTSLL